VPIGLIHTSWGGTPAEAWTNREVLEAEADFEPILTRHAERLADFPRAKEEHAKKLEDWKLAAEKAKAEETKPPRRPRAPLGPDDPHSPAGLYNGMISPLIPYGIAGAIWYQGESNAGRAYQYRKLFPAMIKNWRKDWKQGNFPFLFVQLANFMATKPEPGESAWAELREAQTMTLSLPNTGMATIIDIGEAKDIHPKNKQDVGKRLALWALARTYKKDVVPSGPIYRSMIVDDGEAMLNFDHVGGGLVARGGEALKGFAIAGADRKFVWADAKIMGNTIVVRSDDVPELVAVRYAWADNPVCNLYNKEDLPAGPFRTDSWPGVTVDKK
jgi:sialate O-acetylesterase